MLISIPSRDCRLAIAAAIIAGKQRFEEDKAKFSEQAYQQLRGGAEHNGMKVDDARDKEMREMVDRDVEHMLEQHPVKQTLDVLKLMERMLSRNIEDFVVIDDADFNMLEEYLPAVEEVETEAA